MTVSSIDVADAASADKFIHTNQRTISSVAREDQYFLHGEPAYPTYHISTGVVSSATTADHLLQVMGDGTNYSRLVRWRLQITSDRPAADSYLQITILRLSTAGTGGTALNDEPHDSADSYAGDMRKLPTSKGTESSGALDEIWYGITTAFPASGVIVYEWEPPVRGKPIIFGTATTSGLCWKIVSGVASCQVVIDADILTTSYL